MPRPAAAALLALALLAPGPGLATSIGRALPHDPVLGCIALGRVVAELGGKAPDKDAPYALRAAFFTDDLGRVEPAELAAFHHAMRNAAGRPDREPVRVGRVYRIHADRYRPSWLVMLERQTWQPTRFETDDMLIDREIDDPAYRPDWSWWLVTFQSSRVSEFREAGELYTMMKDGHELENCGA
ncbi:MAG TPA: hypothetical protein VEZ70_02330 [Allosphingosinicella sp.]|nr:hypothetical protein [Allosphingosinicella sp.]